MRTFRVALVAAFLGTVPATAFGDLDFRTGPPDGIQPTTMTLTQVIALNTKAEGKQLDSFATHIEEWTADINGNETTRKVIWSGKDFKETEHIGPFVSQSGRIGGVRWEQNLNGLVVIEGGAHQEGDIAEQAIDDARAGNSNDAIKLLGEVSSPVAAYVVEIKTGPDTATWMFIDKSSGQDVREESVWNGIRTTETYTDFASFSGAVVAQTIRSSPGQGEVVRKLTSLRVNVPVPPSVLNLPASRHDLVQFPTGATSVNLPVSMPHSATAPVLFNVYSGPPSGTGKSHIVVRVNINGRGLDFALDSGASGIFIDREVANQLGLTGYGSMGQALEDEQRSSIVSIPEMHIGDLVMRNVAAYPVSFQMRTADTEQVIGLIGFDFIESLGVKVDYDKGQVTAYPPGTMPLPTTAVTVPITLDDYVPYVSVTVGDVASDHFVLDTGSGADILPIMRGGQFVDIATGGVTIFPRFAAAHPEETRDQGLGKQVQVFVPALYLGVVGGTAQGYPVQLKRVVFGTTFTNFIATVIDPNSHWGGQDLDGLVGYATLHYFNLYFDYPNSRILLEPNDQFRAAEHTAAGK